MGKLKMTAKVVSQETLATDVYSLVLEAPEIASQAIAGQFVSVYTHDGSKMLPRPISLCGIDRRREHSALYTEWLDLEQRNFHSLRLEIRSIYWGLSATAS